ncbi:MAG: ATP-binding protein [Ignavibacteriaceae bacterium]|nr:ATP-binding protein [Ignavibacteriaceae bacterium]
MEANNLLEYGKINDFLNSTWVIQENLEDGIFIINREHEIIRANKSFINIFNKIKINEIIGKKCFNLFDNNEAICENCPVEKTFKEGAFGQHVINRQKIGGEKIILKESLFLLVDENSAISHALVYSRDCTYEDTLEEQLRSSVLLIGLEKLAAGIAHEIRNPLGNITAAAQYFLSKSETDGEMKKYLKLILRNSERMNKAIKDLINLAKPHEVAFTIGTIDKIIDNVCLLVQARLLKQHVQLCKKISHYRPKILLDEKLLEEVFLNIILNAIEAMPKGGKLTISVYTEQNGDEVVINVTDTGVGISEGNIDKIFDPFFTTKKDGTGFGLSLVRQIVELHKGKIEVKSKLDYGTEVKIILPSYKEDIL